MFDIYSCLQSASIPDKSNIPIDYLWLHEVGCTCDIVDLPHHVSEKEEILKLIQQVKGNLLQTVTPLVITIARYSVGYIELL